METPERKVSLMRMGQVLIKNVAQCGGCHTLLEFPFFTSRINVDVEIEKVHGWADTYEYGLLCPECLFDLWDDINFRPKLWEK